MKACRSLSTGLIQNYLTCTVLKLDGISMDYRHFLIFNIDRESLFDQITRIKSILLSNCIMAMIKRGENFLIVHAVVTRFLGSMAWNFFLFSLLTILIRCSYTVGPMDMIIWGAFSTIIHIKMHSR